MKYLVFITLLAISNAGFAENLYSITLGYKKNESLWLRQKKINNKEIYIIGYKSPENSQLERALPRKDFANIVTEFQKLTKEFQQRQASNPNPFCQERVPITENNKKSILCLDTVNHKDKLKLIQWVAKYSDLVVIAD